MGLEALWLSVAHNPFKKSIYFQYYVRSHIKTQCQVCFSTAKREMGKWDATSKSMDKGFTASTKGTLGVKSCLVAD